MIENFFKDIKTDNNFYIDSAKHVIAWNEKGRPGENMVHGEFTQAQFMGQIAYLREELKEYQEACDVNDHVEALDAAADVFVVASFLVYMFFGDDTDVIGKTLNQPIGDYLNDKVYDNFVAMESVMTDAAQMAYASATILHQARNTLVRSRYTDKAIMKEVLKSNDSKYPTKKELLQIWDTKDINEAIEKECRAIEERSKDRESGAYTGVNGVFNEKYKVYVFRDSNNKIMKPSTFRSPDIKSIITK